MKKNSGYIWKLGMFVIIGIVIFIIALYFVGKNRNLFGSTFHLKSKFKNVSGLKIGNNVRFSGINIGTVEEIDFESDTVVIVNLLIKKEVQQYIKIDAVASIGSDGLMGDKVLSISPGTTTKSIVKDEATILSSKALEMDDIMKSVKKSVDNAAVISNQLAQFSYKMNNNDGALSKFMTDASFANSLEKTLVNLESSSNEFAVFTKKMNNKNGVLSKLVNDEKLGKSIDTTITNIQTATQKLNEIEEAAKHNFLLRGYFNKKEKEESKTKK
jgi:phospholipid/cholesterol/gamma-HCH transport system substrate-binding protein